MFSVTHRHEQTSERTDVDIALDLNQPANSKELDGLRPDHISPSALFGLFCNLAVKVTFMSQTFYRLGGSHASP